MKAIGVIILGLTAFVFAFGDSDTPDSGRWKDAGYASYTHCKNSNEVLLLVAEQKLQYPNVSANTIKHMLCE
jgi:hypothetical protein